jgi:hypothetical protein
VYREQYAKLKAECHAMDELIGSGEVVTSPRINEDGTAVEEYNNGEISGAGVSSPHQNGKNPKCVNVV